jgi:hypothetical protein
MSPVGYRRWLVVAMIFGAVRPCGATPCDWVDRPRWYEQPPALGAEVARQAGFRKARLGELMQYHGWHIIEIVPDSSEPEWLFYSRDLMGAHAIANWSRPPGGPFPEVFRRTSHVASHGI